MSTNSMIAYYDGASDSVVATYCHYDGYPEHNGKMLVQHYNNSSDAKKVALAGYISGLEADLSESVSKSANRGDPMNYASIGEFLSDMVDCPHIEYVYLWADGKWKVLSQHYSVSPLFS